MVVRPTLDHDQAALADLERFADHPALSYVDCTSFAIMRAQGIRVAFTFDRRQIRDEAGFHIVP